MRVLAEDQYNELTEHIKQLEAENQYLKKLLDGAGIPYDQTDNNSVKDEPSVVSIKEEPITKELVQFYYSMFKGRRDVYSLRSGKPNAKTGKHGYYTQCDNFWKAGLHGLSREGPHRLRVLQGRLEGQKGRASEKYRTNVKGAKT